MPTPEWSLHQRQGLVGDFLSDAGSASPADNAGSPECAQISAGNAFLSPSVPAICASAGASAMNRIASKAIQMAGRHARRNVIETERAKVFSRKAHDNP